MQRKRQAVMEFLMAYGWAILAVIIVISILAYFWVFNPGKCTLTAPLGYKEHSINTSTIRLIVRNDAGETINLTSVAVGDCTAVTIIGEVADGATEDIQLTVGCGTLTIGSKYRGNITIKYLKSGATIEQISTGSLSGKIKAA